MKLMKTNETITPEEIREQNRKRGKRSRTKGANYERTIAKKFKEFLPKVEKYCNVVLEDLK